jgi:hypothetical protein
LKDLGTIRISIDIVGRAVIFAQRFTVNNNPGMGSWVLAGYMDYRGIHPKPVLYVSTSVVSVAGVLLQLGDDNHEHVIYYISKNLSGPPLKYKHKEKLALAVILPVQKLHHYILLHTTKVVADSNPIQYFLIR